MAATAERALGRATSRRGERTLGISAILALGVSAVLSLVVAPPDAVQGEVQRIMYVHVPAAWLAYLSFFVVFVASIAYLRTKKTRWDRVAAASAEIGVLFTALAIVLGMLWGKPVWGTWWTWDPRLTTTAVLLLIYVSYLAIRRITDNPSRRARWAAVVGIVGFVAFRNSAFAQLADRGLTSFDLEYDVRAFNDQLPRVRIIPIDEFDPAQFL